MTKQLRVFRNSSAKDLVFYVESYPDQYVLKPGEVMHVSFEQEDGTEMETVISDGLIQLFVNDFDTATVTIDGVAVEPWQDRP